MLTIATSDFFVFHLSHFCLNRYATSFMQGIKINFLHTSLALNLLYHYFPPSINCFTTLAIYVYMTCALPLHTETVENLSFGSLRVP